MKNKQVTAEAWHVLFQAASLCWLYSGVGHIVSVKINCIYIYVSEVCPCASFLCPSRFFSCSLFASLKGGGG